MMSNFLNKIQVGEYDLLSQQETKRLLLKSQQGNKNAKDKLVKHNLRLVLKIAHRFKNSRYPLDDIFQVGIFGLIKAIDRFNLGRKVKFSTYAVPLIIGEIKVFLRDDDVVKVSRKLKQRAYQIRKTKEELQERLNREPTVQELSEELGLSTEEIVKALEAVQTPKSIYSSVYKKDSGLELIDQLVDNNNEYNNRLNKLLITNVLEKLDERSSRIIKLRYFAEKSQQEIAKSIGVSQAQISRLEKKILKVIKENLEADKHR